LVPFWIEGTNLKSDSYDLGAYKVELAATFHELNLRWILQIVVHSNIDAIIAQIRECAASRPTLVFNLCDGYDDVGTPGLSVVRALESSGLTFTGSSSRYYEISSSKLAMKALFVEAGVPTASWEILPGNGSIHGLCKRLGTPLIVKPSASSASFGIGLKSVIHTDQQAILRFHELRQGELGKMFANDIIFAERFIEGPEYTILIFGYWDSPDDIWALPPAQRAFDSSIPENERFLSYDRYWAFYKEETPPADGRPFYVYQPAPPEVAGILFDLAKRAYIAVEGFGYGRVDFRFNRGTGEYQVLEVNANCGLSGDAETSCGSILNMANQGFPQLVAQILDQALVRAGQ
jgi:D-alanine-D-alanine ligase